MDLLASPASTRDWKCSQNTKRHLTAGLHTDPLGRLQRPRLLRWTGEEGKERAGDRRSKRGREGGEGGEGKGREGKDERGEGGKRKEGRMEEERRALALRGEILAPPLLPPVYCVRVGASSRNKPILLMICVVDAAEERGATGK